MAELNQMNVPILEDGEKAMAKSKSSYSIFSPYPRNMHRFFTEVAMAKPQQGAYYTLYNMSPEFEKFFTLLKDKDNNFMGLRLKEDMKEEFLATKNKFNIR